jgi:hypothetical protein
MMRNDLSLNLIQIYLLLNWTYIIMHLMYEAQELVIKSKRILPNDALNFDNMHSLSQQNLDEYMLL